MELKVKLSEVKFNLLTSTIYPFTCIAYLENGDSVEASCTDIDELEYGWSVIFRAISIEYVNSNFDAFEIRYNRYKRALARYEKVRYVYQQGYLYFYIEVKQQEVE